MGSFRDVGPVQGSYPVQDGHRPAEKAVAVAGPRQRPGMEKEELIQLAERVLNSDAGLGFLLRLETEDLKTLIACIRLRVESGDKK